MVSKTEAIVILSQWCYDKNSMTLNQMRNLSPDWNIDGAPRPSDIAITNANKIIEILDRPVATLQPSVEGGVFISFKNGTCGVVVECYNDGEIGYSLLSFGKHVVSKDMRRDNIREMDMLTEMRRHLGQQFRIKLASAITV